MVKSEADLKDYFMNEGKFNILTMLKSLEFWKMISIAKLDNMNWNYPEINSKNINHMSEKRKRSIHLPSQQERMLLGHYDPLFIPFQKLPYQNSGIHNQMYKTRFATDLWHGNLSLCNAQEVFN